MKNLLKRISALFLPCSFFIASSSFAQQTCLGSLQFDANNTAVELPATNVYYNPGPDGFTWECWFKLTTTLNGIPHALISSVDNVQYDDIYLGFGWTGGVMNTPGNTLVFRVDPAAGGTPVDPNCTYLPPSGFLANTWYHAAGVIDYNANLKYLYVNGALVDTQPATSTPQTRVIKTNIGNCAVCWPFSALDGRIDEVRMWKTPRSAAQIGADWNTCLAGNEPNLILYDRCNQVGALTVLDATTNSFNGIFLNGNPSWSTDNCPVSGANCTAACKCLGSLDFNFTNDAVQLPPNNQYYSGNGFTWETWFKLNQPIGTIDKPLISAVDWTYYEDYYLGFGWHGGLFNTDYDTLTFRVDGPGAIPSVDQSCRWMPPGGFVVGQWYHAAGVADYNAGFKYLYVNGMLVDTEPLTVAPNSRVIQTNLSACDGCSNYNSNFCNMDEVRIWSTPLNSWDIAGNYQKCRIGNETGLLIYYRCNMPGSSIVFDGAAPTNNGTFRTAAGWSNENAPVSGAFCTSDCFPETPGNPPTDRLTGIAKEIQQAHLSIYPNPSSGTIKVASDQPGVLTVYSVTGQLISEIKVQKAEQEVKLQNVKPGIYLYVFSSGASTSSGKLIIE